jgi:hypothetical protein
MITTFRIFTLLATAPSVAAALFLTEAAQAQPASNLPALPGVQPNDLVAPEKIAPPMLQSQHGGVIRPPHGIDPSIQKPVPDPTIDQKSVIVPASPGGVDTKPEIK